MNKGLYYTVLGIVYLVIFTVGLPVLIIIFIFDKFKKLWQTRNENPSSMGY